MIIKTKSEIQFSIIGAEINLENGTIAIIVNAKNPCQHLGIAILLVDV